MKIGIIDKWFENHKVLTREQYGTLDSMYNIILKDLETNSQQAQKLTEKPGVTFETVYRSWTFEEDNILREKYPKMTLNKIYKKNLLPGRTRSSISNRIVRLKLKKYQKKPKKTKSIEIIEKKPKPEKAPVEKSTITIVNHEGTPVKGFTQHKDRRIQEIRERKRMYNKEISLETKIT